MVHITEYTIDDRQRFLREASIENINNYLNKLEYKSKKSKVWEKIYEEDMKYYMSLPISPMSGGSIARALGPGGYCPRMTMTLPGAFGTIADNSCAARIDEIIRLENAIRRATAGVGIAPIIVVQTVGRYLTLLMCCTSEWYRNVLKRHRVRRMAFMIASSPNLTKIARDLLEELLDIDNDVYIREYSTLKRQSKTSGYKYQDDRKKILAKHGVANMFATTLIDLIIDRSLYNNRLFTTS